MIKIKRREAKQQKEFTIDSSLFVCCDMQTYFEDTSIAKVYIHPKVVEDITNWSTESLNTQPVKEVGGFLLGNYKEEEKIETFVQHFVPATTIEFNSPSLLNFGAAALQLLDQAMQEHPQLQLVGWFHTHPGHTPYLSHTDMNIQEGFFRESYHIAIVLDSLTENFDTGIFTRKNNQTINNKLDWQGEWIKWR